MSRYEREFGKNENVTQLREGIEKTAKWLGIIRQKERDDHNTR